MSVKKPAILNEFKEFITRGNVLDMAVGIIIGGAFTSIVNSLVNDILNPFINTIFGGFGFDSMNVEVKFPWITFMREELDIWVDYPTFAFGNFLSAIISFFVTAIALFFLVKGINTIRKDLLSSLPYIIVLCPHFSSLQSRTCHYQFSSLKNCSGLQIICLSVP